METLLVLAFAALQTETAPPQQPTFRAQNTGTSISWECMSTKPTGERIGRTVAGSASENGSRAGAAVSPPAGVGTRIDCRP